MKNIAVCVKQVPDTTEIRIHPEDNTLIREGVPSILNPFDRYALEAAAKLKDQDTEIQIYVLTMGGPQSEAVLRDCLAMAADKAFLVSDRVLGGSDTYATAYALTAAIKAVERRENIVFDAIFCGRQAIDGETAQVGSGIAEHLDLPQVTCALELSDAASEHLTILREADDEQQLVSVGLPAVVTFTKPAFEPRMATMKRKLQSKKAEIPVLSVADFADFDASKVGIKGSPTKVKKSFVPERNKSCKMIEEGTERASCHVLCEALSALKLV